MTPRARAIVRLSILAIGFPLSSVSAEGGAELFGADRVVFLGNTFFEREARDGYIETALTAAFPDRDIQFRNLGWSGDTVFGEARSYFGPPSEGIERLTGHLDFLKPTLVLLAYGGNEALEGEENLARFLAGLGELVDPIERSGARIAILTPTPHEKLDFPPPYPDVRENNELLAVYSEALCRFAAEREIPSLDLFHPLREDFERGPDPAAGDRPPLTDNGIHLTADGYRRAAGRMLAGLGVEIPRWEVGIDLGGGEGAAIQFEVSGTQLDSFGVTDSGRIRFRATDAILPLPWAEMEGDDSRTLRIRNLPEGEYALGIDGREILRASESEFAGGVRIDRGPGFFQSEDLREAIRSKNELFFHRWRPQNETYIFGFRRYEQGQNAGEIPQFDPLIAEREEILSRLRRPVPRSYEIRPVKGEGSR